MKVNYSLKKNLALLLIICGSFASRSQILINEYSAANLTNMPDSYGKFEDWIELYNVSGSTVDISGFFLSDDLQALNKFPIPAGTIIGPNSTYLIFASGRNGSFGGEVHTNFKLTQTKNNAELIILSNPSNVIQDSIRVKKTKLGQSRARFTNGAGSWSVCTFPTPANDNIGNMFTGYADRPSMSYTAGFYPSAITVSLTNNEPTSNAIYYTVDGTEPTTLSTLYSGAINISTTQIVKAIATSTNPSILTSFIEFNTYFINETHTIPRVSISGTSLTILANGTQSLKPVGTIEYFNKVGLRTATSYGGFNSHGQDSWVHSHRSLDFVARDEMGYSSGIKEQLFSQTTRDKFQRVILRAAGDDNYPADFDPNNVGSAHLRDAYFQTLCKDGGMKLDIRTGSKCVVYLNGAYWGVYDLRELPDDHDYTDYNYGQGKYDLQYILTWGSTWAEYGGAPALSAWSTLRSYIFANSMSVQANYDYVYSQLDVESLADYVIGHSMSVSSDWLNYNTGWWRGMNPNGTHKKWGYILWDNDASFDFYINYTGIPSTSYTAPICNVDNLYAQNWSDPEEHTKVLKRLRDNPGFNNWYINRYVDLMNTTFSCQNMLDFLDSTKNVIAPEMTRQCARWGGTYAGWLANFQTLRNFISNRCGTTDNNGIKNCYNLTGPYPVTFSVSPTGAGKVGVNSLTVAALPWAASYYGNIDVNISATAYSMTTQFVKWIPLNNPTILNDGISANKIKFTKRDTVTAHFVIDVGVQENSNPQIDQASVYPNPANEAFTITFDLTQRTPVSIKMFNVSGQQVGMFAPSESAFEKGSYKIDVNSDVTSTLNSGIYFVQISTANYSQTFKLIIQK